MRRGTGLAVAAAAAALVAACGGKDSCPTAAAYPKTPQTPACSMPAPQQVTITLEMCEACSHTSPTCTADLSAVGSGEIFLDTKWEVCTDNSSCSNNACATPTCQFSVANGTYTVHALTQSGTSTFQLTMSGGTPSCSGSI
jgi:hypothetical protein